jgi:hypothetical protein
VKSFTGMHSPVQERNRKRFSSFSFECQENDSLHSDRAHKIPARVSPGYIWSIKSVSAEYHADIKLPGTPCRLEDADGVWELSRSSTEMIINQGECQFFDCL